MTANRDPDRLLRAWLDLMPDEAPDRVIDSVLHATTAAPQARTWPWDGPRRFEMNRVMLFAAVAALAVALVGGAVLLSSGHSPTTAPTSAPPITPGPTAGPTVADAVAPMPEAVWGDWLAQADPIPGIVPTAQLIQLSMNWDGGRTAWVQTRTQGPLVVESSSIAAPNGEIHFRSDVGSHGCTFGDDGRYRWSRSSDGMFLTLEPIEEACAARGAALARTWVHSLGAVNDGGPGVTYSTSPMTQVTVPRGQRLAATSGADWLELKTYGAAQPFQAFVIVRNPGGFGAPCSTTDTKKQSIATTTAAFIKYIEGLPGMNLTKEVTEIDGHPAIQFDYRIASNVNCESGEIAALHPSDLSDTYVWSSIPGELQRMYIVQIDPSTTFLLWYQGNSETERSVIGSVRFIDSLPTP